MQRLLKLFVLITFCFSNLSSYPVFAANVPYLPPTGQMIVTSQSFMPVILKGVTVDSDNPFRLSFLLDEGDTNLTKEQLEKETNILVRYFLAALTTPEDDLWVNLSPYENNRIIPQTLGLTDMGRDLLAQDYILKQLSASLTYPESESGKAYWNAVHSELPSTPFLAKRGSEQSFTKIWIVPNKTQILESGLTAYIKTSTMKVMTENDYLAMQNNSERPLTPSLTKRGNDAFKQHILPLIEQDVNNGQNFAYLRQIHNAIVLAAWFKKRLKDTIYNQLYIDKKKIAGIDNKDPNAVNQIYNQYVDAFKQGVYNYVKRVPYGDNLAATSRGVLCAGVRSSRIAYFSGGYRGAVSAEMSVVPASTTQIADAKREEVKSPANAKVDLSTASPGETVNPAPRSIFKSPAARVITTAVTLAAAGGAMVMSGQKNPLEKVADQAYAGHFTQAIKGVDAIKTNHDKIIALVTTIIYAVNAGSISDAEDAFNAAYRVDPEGAIDLTGIAYSQGRFNSNWPKFEDFFMKIKRDFIGRQLDDLLGDTGTSQEAKLATAKADWTKALTQYISKNHPSVKLTDNQIQVLSDVHMMPGGWLKIEPDEDVVVTDKNGTHEVDLSNGKTVTVKLVSGESVKAGDTVVVRDVNDEYRLSTIRVMHNGVLGATVGSSQQNREKREAAIAGGIDPKLYDDLALVGLEGVGIKAAVAGFIAAGALGIAATVEVPANYQTLRDYQGNPNGALWSPENYKLWFGLSSSLIKQEAEKKIETDPALLFMYAHKWVPHLSKDDADRILNQARAKLAKMTEGDLLGFLGAFKKEFPDGQYGDALKKIVAQVADNISKKNLAKARSLVDAIAVKSTKADAMIDLAVVESAAGFKDSAQATFEEAFKLMSPFRDAKDEAQGLTKIAVGKFRAGFSKQAQEIMSHVMKVVYGIENLQERAQAFIALGLAQFEAGFFDDSRISLVAAVEAAGGIEDLSVRIKALTEAGIVQAQLGLCRDFIGKLYYEAAKRYGAADYSRQAVIAHIASLARAGFYDEAIDEHGGGYDSGEAEVLPLIAARLAKVGLTSKARAVLDRAVNVVNGKLYFYYDKPVRLKEIERMRTKLGFTEDAKATFAAAVESIKLIADKKVQDILLAKLGKGMAKVGLYDDAVTIADGVEDAELKDGILVTTVVEQVNDGLFPIVDKTVAKIRNGYTQVSVRSEVSSTKYLSYVSGKQYMIKETSDSKEDDAAIRFAVEEGYQHLLDNPDVFDYTSADNLTKAEKIKDQREKARVFEMILLTRARMGMICGDRGYHMFDNRHTVDAVYGSQQVLLSFLQLITNTEEVQAKADSDFARLYNGGDLSLVPVMAAWHNSVSRTFTQYDISLTPDQYYQLWNIHLQNPKGWKLAPKEFKTGEVIVDQPVYDTEGNIVGFEDIKVVEGSDGKRRMRRGSIKLILSQARQVYDVIGSVDKNTRGAVRQVFLDGGFGNETKEDTAMAPKETNGGIDDREGLMRMEIQRDGTKIPMFKNIPIDINNFAGFSFKIVSITRTKVNHAA